MEVVVASSPVDAGIGCWDLRTGAEQLRYRSCASPPHGLISVSGRFLASSQLRDSSSSSSSGTILYWSWDKPQVEVRSFPAEPIIPLVSNSDGTYIIGGGSSGNIYLWEVVSGKLLKKWQAHYRAVTCMAFSDDESFLISGAEDGCIRVWSLLMYWNSFLFLVNILDSQYNAACFLYSTCFMVICLQCRMFDDMANVAMKPPYQYSFFGHSLRVTDVTSGHGLCNSIVISSSEDRTCKIWSLSKGKLLRSITFPSIIDVVVIDPGEHLFYAGGRDGKIYIAALNAESTSSSSYGMHIIGSLFDHSKAIICLAYSIDGVTLVSGSEDGTIRVWDTKNQHVIRIFKYAKGPVNNVLVVRLPLHSSPEGLVNGQVSLSRKRVRLLMPPPLDKYTNSVDGDIDTKTVTSLQPSWDEHLDGRYFSSLVMKQQIQELQQQGSSGAAEMELERLRLECKRSMEMLQQWKKLYQDLQKVCVNELLVKGQAGDADKTA